MFFFSFFTSFPWPHFQALQKRLIKIIIKKETGGKVQKKIRRVEIYSRRQNMEKGHVRCFGRDFFVQFFFFSLSPSFCFAVPFQAVVFYLCSCFFPLNTPCGQKKSSLGSQLFRDSSVCDCSYRKKGYFWKRGLLRDYVILKRLHSVLNLVNLEKECSKYRDLLALSKTQKHVFLLFILPFAPLEELCYSCFSLSFLSS